jgi:hypothetical protein
MADYAPILVVTQRHYVGSNNELILQSEKPVLRGVTSAPFGHARATAICSRTVRASVSGPRTRAVMQQLSDAPSLMPGSIRSSGISARVPSRAPVPSNVRLASYDTTRERRVTSERPRATAALVRCGGTSG